MLDRRDFLKLGGATAFAALFGGCERIPKKIIPFVIPPENTALGESLGYASVCRQCPAGCGIVVRVSEGRAKKIEGNPLHPVNRGKLCARGQAGLQALYHPERIGRPLKLSGPRGSGKFAEISWEEALSILLTGLKKLQAGAPASLLMLTEPMRGHRNLVAARFMRAFGSPHRVAWDPFGQDALLAANEAVFGIRDVPEYDLANARYLLSFSGDFLETGISPVHYGRAYGQMRQSRPTVRGKFVHFGPRLSMTAANADVFLPVAPGSEGAAALGIAHVMVREKLTPSAAAAASLWAAGLSRMTPEAVGKTTGLPPSDIEAVAREFAGNAPGIAMAGDGAAGCTNGTYNLACAALLNALAGNVGRPGGISFPNRLAAFSRFGADAGLLLPPPESGFASVRDSVEKMRKGTYRLALLSGSTNPAFTLPAPLKFGEALLSVPQIVSFASFLDETASLSDLVLPVPTYLEEWGDDIAPAGHAGDALSMMQPVVDPFRDTRSMPDILIAAARELGGPVAAALPWAGFRECVEKSYAGMGVDLEDARRDGGVFPGKAPAPRTARKGEKPSLPATADAEFEGDPARYPLFLHVYPSIAHSDGRGANLSWLQELPDPVTTAVWRNWVEVNPKTAETLGLADGDGVVVASPFGSMEAFVVIHPAMAPGVVALPLGQGHTRYGTNAANRGGNPFSLLPVKADRVSGAPARQSARVSLVKAKLQGSLVRTVNVEGQWKYENIL
ncbi:MAG: molybdopterin-dependent oxidoreductase [Deltaproteobacteria bacterium]